LSDPLKHCLGSELIQQRQPSLITILGYQPCLNVLLLP
jgi:hypothetical protein